MEFFSQYNAIFKVLLSYSLFLIDVSVVWEVKVKPRFQKYVVGYTFDRKSNHVLQLNAIAFDQELKAHVAFRNQNTGHIAYDVN